MPWVKLKDIHGKSKMNQNIQVIQPDGIFNGIRGNDLRREVNDVMKKGTLAWSWRNVYRM